MPAIPTSLYIHLPWCEKKCPYCDFNSHTLQGTIPYAHYRERLCTDFEQEWEQYQAQVPNPQPLISVFIGGGTPSLWPPEELAPLIAAIQPALQPGAEITLEANPGSADADRFAGYRALGISRLSLGVQSFHDPALRHLGRIHTGAEAHAAIAAIQQAGFSRWNLDLMFGLPEQTPEAAMRDLETALAYHPPHVSWYQLTLEPHTAFYRHPPPLPSLDTIHAITDAGNTLLADAGLERYEVSAFCHPQSGPCQHNVHYWEFGDYIGIGAGAHGKRTEYYPDDPDRPMRIIRTTKQKAPMRYLDPQQPLIAHQHPVPPADLPVEFFMNVLRLVQGVPAAYWETRTGQPWSTIAPTLQSLAAHGWWQNFPERLQCSSQGSWFIEDLLLAIATSNIPKEGDYN